MRFFSDSEEALKTILKRLEYYFQMQSEMDVLTGSGSSLVGGASAISSPTASLSGTPAAVPQLTNEEKVEVDSRSIYVGNVDYGANAEELEQHFHG